MAPKRDLQHLCGCKGIRSCLLCEVVKGIDKPEHEKERYHFVYNPLTKLAVGEQQELSRWAFSFPGVFLLENFVSKDEESQLVTLMDLSEWRPSQSGRRKQDYGPKVNFKKQKVQIGSYSGLPPFSQKLFDRMKKHMILEDFLPVEQCNLDYNPERGSAIVSHFDDSWLWGERLVSVNLLSETVLTMSCDSESTLPLFHLCDPVETDVPSYQKELNSALQKCTDECFETERDLLSSRLSFRDVDVAIHLPRCSLVVLYGQARYDWKHAIHREHIRSRRICSTFRELSSEFSSSGKQEVVGKELLEIALQFQGAPV